MNKPQKFINGKNGLAKLMKNLKEKLEVITDIKNEIYKLKKDNF
jgi:hypothetical protein